MKILLLVGLFVGPVVATDLAFLEQTALGDDRQKALELLVPGTEDWYYYRCLLLQQQGKLHEVDALIEKWRRVNKNSDARNSMELRQALLWFDQDPGLSSQRLAKLERLNFNHQPDIPGAARNYPSKLDPEVISWKRLTTKFLRDGNIGGFSQSGLKRLLRTGVPDQYNYRILQKLEHPDVPGLHQVVIDDLNTRKNARFGDLSLHSALTLEQLKACLTAKGDLFQNQAFVKTWLDRLQPDVHLEPGSDEQGEHLKQMWTFCADLPPVHNQLKVSSLYHLLKYQLDKGLYNRDLFMAYLKLPRSGDYVNAEYLKQAQFRGIIGNIASPGIWEVGGIRRVPSDEPLVRKMLIHFLAQESGYQVYNPYLNETWLKRTFVEAHALAGKANIDELAALVKDPSFLHQLRDRVELDLVPENPSQFKVDEPVRLLVDIKNVPDLLIKIFRINTVNYGLRNGKQVDLAIDLDGLRPNLVRRVTYDEPPLVRKRVSFDFPSLNEAGTYVVEFIGNGRSSRALIHKGALSATYKTTQQGLVFTIFDENHQWVRDAVLQIEGHQFKPNEQGHLTVPYASEPSRRTAIFKTDSRSGQLHFTHPAATYDLKVDFHLETETIRAGSEAQLLVRPLLSLNGLPVSVKHLQKTTLKILSTDLQGVESAITQPNFKLYDDQESVFTLRIPNDLISIEASLIAEVAVDDDKEITLSDQWGFAMEPPEQREKQFTNLYLSRSEEGWRLYCLGKNGEPITNRLIHLEIKSWFAHGAQSPLLQTDNNGSIELGQLTDVVSLGAVDRKTSSSQHWQLSNPTTLNKTQVLAKAGEKVYIPLPSTSMKKTRDSVLFLAGRSGNKHDLYDQLQFEGAYAVIPPLSQGKYLLGFPLFSQEVNIEVVQGEAKEGYLITSTSLIPYDATKPLAINSQRNGKGATLFLDGFSSSARVHVFATMFQNPRMQANLLQPQTMVFPKTRPNSAYISGRNIGDEYRYILDRKQLVHYPGNMLERPGLLLNPFSLRATERKEQQAMAGDDWEVASPRSTTAGAMAEVVVNDDEHDTWYVPADFLAEAPVVLLNQKANPKGILKLSGQQLGGARFLYAVVIDGERSAATQLPLGEAAIATRDLRLAPGLDPKRDLAEEKRVSLINTDQTLRIADGTAASVQIYDQLDQVFNLFRVISESEKLEEFAFVLRWPEMDDDERLELYGKYACHELNFFLYHKDRVFFDAIIAPYIANKMDKTFLDRWLLGQDLTTYLQPWYHQQLNVVERILLGMRHQTLLQQQHIKDLLAVIPPDLEDHSMRFQLALGLSALSRQDLIAKAFADKDFNAKVSPKRKAAGGRRVESVMEIAPGVTAEEEYTRKIGLARGFYKSVDTTKEWAESNYYKLGVAEQNADLVEMNPFWRDFSRHGKAEGFRSTHLALIGEEFAEMMLALAVLDLPFKAKQHQTSLSGKSWSFKAASPAIVFHREIGDAPKDPNTRLLVTQNIYSLDEPTRLEGGRKVDTYLSGDLLTGKGYGCTVIISNPTEQELELNVLLQIPAGAIAINDKATDGIPVLLDPYEFTDLEYYFYFPKAGKFTHYPATATLNGKVMGRAVPTTINVVDQTPIANNWNDISQRADSATVLKYLNEQVPAALDLSKIAWRMNNRGFYDKTISLLEQRRVYEPSLWSYAVHHEDGPRIRTWLRHNNRLVARLGAYFESEVFTTDPVARGTYQHLEYHPLINPRSHQLGEQRKIPDQGLKDQYIRLLTQMSHQARPGDSEILAMTGYLLYQDRIEEALTLFQRIDVNKPETRLQHDYLNAYLCFYTGKLDEAAHLAQNYTDYPVPRWQRRFNEIIGQLAEIEGREREGDMSGRDRTMDALVASEPSLEMRLEGATIQLYYRNLTSCTLNFYPMDVELLFSRQPFLQNGGDRFSVIEPNASMEVELPASAESHWVDLPEEFARLNVFVEAVAGGVRKTAASYANALDMSLVGNYGQIILRHKETGKPRAAAYVKVYARLNDGQTVFYKDGYTDRRGRFDYATLSNNTLDRVRRFSLLVISEEDGALVREVAPPVR